MTRELKMPALSPTMEKGTLAKWHVSVGDLVKPGTVVAEIETDKATMEFEAEEEGRLAEIHVNEGSEDVPVGSVLAVMVDADAAVDAPGEAAADPREKAQAVAGQAEAAPPVSAEPMPVPQSRAEAPAFSFGVSDEVSATPLARRIAAINGIALDTITGSGANGRIRIADLGLRFNPDEPTAQSGAVDAMAIMQNSFVEPPAGVPVETSKLSSMRRTIARRLSESKRSVPHFYLTARCNIDCLLSLRQELNAGLESRNVRISVNDLVIKAMALAMRDVPDVNVQFAGDSLHSFSRADISMAVAIKDGLVTPIIRDAGSRSISDIAVESRTLAEKARAGKLKPEDYQGGTASISNLGMYGIDVIVPVINPPQALILGVGSAVRQPWDVDGEIALAPIMALTASFDHRAIDGAAGAQYMAALRAYIETPISILA